jgi:hypothetical protein
MLVAGSAEQACLSSLFVAQQAPHSTSLLSIEPVPAGVGDAGGAACSSFCRPNEPGPRCTAKVTTQCCCDQATSTAAASSSVCWSGEYTAARCCDRARGPTGDTACWSGSYDYGACCKTPAQKPSAEGKIHRADPYLGPTLTSSNRNYQSNCWVNLKMMGQPCRFQASARRAGAGSRIRRQTAPLRRGPVAALTGACNPMGRRAAANSCARFASRWPRRPRPRRRPMRRSRRS